MSLRKVTENISSWAPDLQKAFERLGIGDDDFSDPLDAEECLLLSTKDSTTAAVQLYLSGFGATKSKQGSASSMPIRSIPNLMLTIEHFRQFPHLVEQRIRTLKPGFKFSNTLSNLAVVLAGELFASAQATSDADIDTSVARFIEAAAEFDFALRSGCLSDPAARLAYGKFAVAITISGRWMAHDQTTLKRALGYSIESFELGNANHESLSYRIELLLQLFDRTGDSSHLSAISELSKRYADLIGKSRILLAEARLRRSLLDRQNAGLYVRIGLGYLMASNQLNGYDRARKIVCSKLLTANSSGLFVLNPSNCSIPNGIASEMAKRPTQELWVLVRLIIDDLNHERTTRQNIASAIFITRLLRQITEGPQTLSTVDDYRLLCECTRWLSDRVKRNRQFRWDVANAYLSLSRRISSRSLESQAQGMFENLADDFPKWPLPRIGMALSQEISSEGDNRAQVEWGKAADLALKTSTYRREDLGGRGEVFSVADARGFLSDTFVFKRAKSDRAHEERLTLDRLSQSIDRLCLNDKFSVPDSLHIHENADGEVIHCLRRKHGVPFRSFRGDAEIETKVRSIVEFIALFHNEFGNPENPQISGWKHIKDDLQLWSRTVQSLEESRALVKEFRETFPSFLPLVRKRDSHASNWLLDESGRIVGLDFESHTWVPAGLDVVQLIEDQAMLPCSGHWWKTRLDILRTYFELIAVPITLDSLVSTYGWMGLSRALRAATEPNSPRWLQRHARELTGVIKSQCSGDVVALAERLELILARIEIDTGVNARRNVRLSRAMALYLRHKGPDLGLSIDKNGFADLETLADLLDVPIGHVLGVALDPNEPRYEIDGGRIRALYGHSLPVFIKREVNLGTPRSLLHGTSWTYLDQIVQSGIRPMGRQKVHLSNSLVEASAIARRKGKPVVLSLRNIGDAASVSDGIWVSSGIEADAFSILRDVD